MIPQICQQRANEFLDVHLPFPSPAFFHKPFPDYERRTKPRCSRSIPARVWGFDADDEPFSLDCRIRNISSSGVYLTVPWKIKEWSDISLVVHLLHNTEGVAAGIRGTVVRVAPQRDGQYGIAVMINEYTFL